MSSFRFRMAPALIAVAVVALAQTAQADKPAQAPPATSRPIDPDRYLGRWYEIARLPNKFQDNCAAATADWSRRPNGQFDVVQTCHVGSPTGPAKIWRGAGRVVDAANALFRIGFFGGFVHMDYRIMDRADDYSWCILTNGNPKYVWIMSKAPKVPAIQKTALVERTRRLGFDVAGLVYDEQPAS